MNEALEFTESGSSPPRRTRTKEQREAAAELAAATAGYRQKVDAEGWPLVPGRNGHLENLGHGQLAAFTTRRQVFRRLAQLVGVRRCQTGDDEFRALLERSAVPAAARMLRCYRRRKAPVNAFEARPTGGLKAVSSTLLAGTATA
jgi:hypothetical protein